MQNQEELQDRYLQLKEDYQDFQIIIFRIGFCHHCQQKEIVYECFRDFKFTSCKYQSLTCRKRYCEECLEKHYRVNIAKVMKKESTWLCPFKTGRCKCSSCNYKDTNNDTQDQIEKYQNEVIPVLMQTPVYQGSRPEQPEQNEQLMKEHLSILRVRPERESVWQQTLYDNGPNQKSTIYIMRNFNQKPGRSAPVVEKIQQALQLNAYIIKMLSSPIPQSDRQQLEAILQHNLYYLSRNADYCKLNGLISFDTKLNKLHEQTEFYNSDVLSLYHIEDDIREKIASQYTKYLQLESHKVRQKEAKEQARFEEQQNRNEKEIMRHQREEQRLQRESEELDKCEIEENAIIAKLRAQIQKLQQRKQELEGGE